MQFLSDVLHLVNHDKQTSVSFYKSRQYRVYIHTYVLGPEIHNTPEYFIIVSRDIAVDVNQNYNVIP